MPYSTNGQPEDESRSQALRDFAERIISGDFEVAVVALMDKDGTIRNMYDGAAIMALGMTEWMRSNLLKQIDLIE